MSVDLIGVVDGIPVFLDISAGGVNVRSAELVGHRSELTIVVLFEGETQGSVSTLFVGDRGWKNGRWMGCWNGIVLQWVCACCVYMFLGHNFVFAGM